ncbi:MAG TPA: TIR domain-containing protein [Solirubrobacterales bacterium]
MTDNRASVFVSYSRSDRGFVRRLLEQLKRSEREVWVDLDDIPPTADWLAEVKAGIEAAETFLFVISPDSISSEVCQTEVAHAAGLNKRIVPVVHSEVDERLVPEPLAQRNWLFFRNEDEFDSGLRALNEALDTDLDWLHAHAELLRRALAWERGGRRRSALLRGTELREAEAWLASESGGGQQPTAAHREFILASRRAAGRRQRSVLAAVSAALVVAIGLGILALTQRSTAIENQKRAESQQLAAVADSQLRVDPERSLLLSLEAVDISETDAALESLKRALGASRVRETLAGDEDAKFSPDGRTVTTIAKGNAYLWDLKSGERMAVSRRSNPSVLASPVVYSPDGSLVAIGESSHSRILDARTGEELARIGGAVGVAFSDDSSLLATGAIRSGVIRIWDPRSGKRLRTLRGHAARVHALVWAPARRLASASLDGTARIWSLEARDGRVQGNGRSVVLRGHENRLRDIDYSPDGETIATASEDGSARLWDASSGAELAVLRSGRHGKVETVDFSPEGSRLVLPHGDGTLQIWTSDGRLLRTLRGHRGEARGAEFSPDGRLIASAGFVDHTARIWDAGSGRTVAVLRGHRDIIKPVHFSPDGSQLVTASGDGTARVWSVSSGEDAVSLTGRGGSEPTALAAAATGRLIATGDSHGNIRLWNSVTGAPVAALERDRSAIRTLAFTPVGKALVAAGDSAEARIHTLAGHGSTKVLRGHHGLINAVAVDGAGDLVLTAGQDGTVRLWGLDGTLERVLGAEGGEEPGEGSGGAPLRTAAFDPAGKRLIAGGDDGVARIWDVRSGRLEHALLAHDGAIERVNFSPDGELAVTAGNDGAAVVWDADRGDRVATLEGHSGALHDARFSPDGQFVVTASDDESARVWDSHSGEQLQLIRGHEARVVTGSFDRQGELVLTAGWDGTARVWDSGSGEPVATLDGPGNLVSQAEFTPGGAVVMRAEDSKTALLYSCELCLAPEALRHLAEERVTRELTPAERAEFLDEAP